LVCCQKTELEVTELFTKQWRSDACQTLTPPLYTRTQILAGQCVATQKHRGPVSLSLHLSFSHAHARTRTCVLRTVRVSTIECVRILTHSDLVKFSFVFSVCPDGRHLAELKSPKQKIDNTKNLRFKLFD